MVIQYATTVRKPMPTAHISVTVLIKEENK